jgi:hypothetical protein
MARQVAFAMQMPSLSEEQEGCVRRYGKEHCEEIRLVKGECSTVFAGILTTAFSNKKVAQNAFGVNLKAWKITKPKYIRDWYRELSLDEYFAEFRGVVRVLGRRLQEQVSYTVNKASWMGAYNSEIRANAVIAKAAAEASAKAASRERALEILAVIMDRRRKACFAALAEPIRQRRRECAARSRAEHQSRMAAEARVKGEKRKAELEHEDLLRSSSQYRDKIKLEKITRERKEQAANVAAFYENRKRKAEQQ